MAGAHSRSAVTLMSFGRGLSACLACVAFAVFHAFQLEPVGIEEEHRIVVVIMLASRVNDGCAEFEQEGLQVIYIPAATQLERIVMEAYIAYAELVRATLSIGRADPEPRLAVGPADRVLVFIRDLEAEESEQPAVEGLRLFVVA